MELSLWDKIQYSAFRSSFGRTIFKQFLYSEKDERLHYESNGLTISGIYHSDNNLTYILTCGSTTVVIDPGFAVSIKDPIVLLTHTHWDHCAGVKDMNFIKLYSFGDMGEKYDVNNTLKFGDLDFKIVPVSTHTPCSVVIELRYMDELHIFTGDSIFSLGTGKFFEGSVESLSDYIEKMKASYPKKALLWPGHDYFEVNRKWCESLGDKIPDLNIPFTVESQIIHSPFFNPQKYFPNSTINEAIVLLRESKNVMDGGL
eukprot:NODE_7_length_67686_cov_1.621421.p27 type:complete len:258 gc:universal NODE_7_length_67686_cov_1.621421:60713-59940(-)